MIKKMTKKRFGRYQGILLYVQKLMGLENWHSKAVFMTEVLFKEGYFIKTPSGYCSTEKWCDPDPLVINNRDEELATIAIVSETIEWNDVYYKKR